MRRILGNIGAFQLPNGKYAFGRIFKDSTVAFYKHFGESENDLPPNEDYAFIVGVYTEGITKMKYVEKRPYADESEVTPPLFYIKDPISGKYEIYDNGEIRPSTYEECKGLERVAAWHLNHVIDRLMGDDKWN